MQACWNKLVFDRPPTTSWRCAANEFASKGFLKAVDKTILELESNTVFQTEAAILSRLIYRMKSKLRSDKGLKNMEKVNRALLNYLRLSLEKDYIYLKENVECNGDIQALPSRQMLQYTLVRTQGFSKLMCRIESVAECAADFFRTRISLGQAWNIAVVAYAVISRIWLLSRYLTKRCCEWYNRLYKYMNKLKLVGVHWLPENHYFPEDLKMWLSVSWINEDLKNFPSKEGLTDSIFNLITQDQDVEEDRDLDLEETKDTSVSSALPVVQPAKISAAMTKAGSKKIALQKSNDTIPVSLDDVGERISRDRFTADSSEGTSNTRSAKGTVVKAESVDDVIEICLKRATENGRKKAKKRKAMSVDDIETKKDVPKFVNSESHPGLDKLQTSKTRLTESMVDKAENVDDVVEICSKRATKIGRKKAKKGKAMSVDDIETKEDVLKFINSESYPGLDKLQWRMLKKNVTILLLKMRKYEASSNTKKQDMLIRKAIKSIREWIN